MSSRKSRRVALGVLVFCLLAVGVAPFLGEAIDFDSQRDRYIFFELRLPRVLLGLCCGAGLAVAGVIMQAMLRNPLATPYTLGVSTGAALGVVIAIAAGVDGLLGYHLGRPLVGMAGAVLVILLTQRVARVRGRLPPQLLLLAGIALTYSFGAMILAIQYSVTPHDTARILRWLLGSLESGLGYGAVAVVGVAVAATLALLVPLGRAYNAMAGGEEAAIGVGVDVERVIRRSYLATSLLVGVIVAFVGPIGFVGLMVPHTLRLLGIVDNRLLILAASLAGGGFLALCDGVTDLLPTGRLPVGVVTQILGGPFFVLLLLKEKRQGF